MNEPTYFPDFANFVEKAGMSTSKLKRALIQRISEIEDQSFLKAIKTILDAKVSASTLHLPPEVVHEIMASKKEVDQGLTIDNDLLEKEVEKWLDQK